MPTGVKCRRSDTAFGIGLILGRTVDHEGEDSPGRKEVLVLSELSDDLLLGAGVALILAQLPVGTGVDALRCLAERAQEVGFPTRNECGGTHPEVAIRMASECGSICGTKDQVLAELPEPVPVTMLEKAERGMLIECDRTHERLGVGSGHVGSPY